MARPVVISPYQPTWKRRFDELETLLRESLGSLIAGIEHVGSTAVPGLDAKPIIDLDLVISDTRDFQQIKAGLAALGYRHLGDQGVPGREAFGSISETEAGEADHHLYVCRESSPELRRHLALRNHLREHPATAAEYGRLKRELAERFGDDREGYTEAKGRFIEQVLRDASRTVSERVP